MNTNLVFICVWLVSAPLGYLSCRWSSRAMGDRWTRNDRLGAVIVSLLYGPLMPLAAVLMVVLWKLIQSDWGNKDAKW